MKIFPLLLKFHQLLFSTHYPNAPVDKFIAQIHQHILWTALFTLLQKDSRLKSNSKLVHPVPNLVIKQLALNAVTWESSTSTITPFSLMTFWRNIPCLTPHLKHPLLDRLKWCQPDTNDSRVMLPFLMKTSSGQPGLDMHLSFI